MTVPWKADTRHGVVTGWQAQVGPLRIDLHTYVGDPTGAYVSCHDLRIDRHRLGDMPIGDVAKGLAFAHVRKVAEEIWKAVEAVSDDEGKTTTTTIRTTVRTRRVKL